MTTLSSAANPRDLPAPDPDAAAHSAQLQALLQAEIARSDGAISFERYMELALYAPGLGYYVAGKRQIGEQGDFVTAPEISSDFGRCVARALAPVLTGQTEPAVLEFGAGNGHLAIDMMRQWSDDGIAPERYLIMEPSPVLRARQRETIARRAVDLLPVFSWLERLPEPGFGGVVVANEVLDAMPVTRFRVTAEGPQEMFVTAGAGTCVPIWSAPRDARLVAALDEIEAMLGALPVGMASEINLHLGPWLSGLSHCLDNAAVLLIDYGYPMREYYHAARGTGTLICHYRHRAHDDPFVLPGLQDITASVDFSRLAAAASTAGFEVSGYTTQAAFLLDAGLEQLLQDADPDDIAAHHARMHGIKKLTLPGEMGERFKVMALTKGEVSGPAGFGLRDLRDRL